MKFDMQSMLEKAQQMQQEMERVKREIASKKVTEESGGGMVQVTVNGSFEILSIKISKEVVNQNDIEMLEDLILAAVNKAIHSTQDLASEEMKKVTGMIPNIPGFNFNI